ncbi:hypothetical protein ACFQZS_18080 [Mucilaginibacter calamicampi]|uniref:Uncharacterized protein n=1 Tax=Mucilaginibacter calamicampi TaxID=1302352 RepID=A0ABW2Z021_9SPHI
MHIKEYIESGALEAFVLGVASEAEERELMQLKRQYPEVDKNLAELEADMERIAQYMAVPPPPDMFERIENTVNDLVIAPETKVMRYADREWRQQNQQENKSRYIEVEAESNYMRLHKSWKWVFAAVFVLGKIFLACAIYFYLESRQAQQQVQELKAESRALQHR